MYLSLYSLWWQFILLAVGSYFMGNINFAVIISKLKGNDIRKVGSGNPGTLNMSRTFGLKIGVLVLLLDMLKGAIPTLIGGLIYSGVYFNQTSLPVSLMAKVLCGFFAVLGHVFPVMMKFKGGKGIATTIGVFAVCNIWVALISGALAIGFIMATEVGSMGSFIATTPGAIAVCLSVYENYILANSQTLPQILVASFTNLLVVGIISLTWYAHRQNIKRLLAGKEHPTNWWQMLKESQIKKKANKDKN